MAVDKCILDKAEKKLVSKKKANEFAKLYREEAEALREEGRLAYHETEKKLAQKLLSDSQRAAARRKRAALFQSAVQKEILADLERGRAANVNANKVLYSRLAMDPRERLDGIEDLYSRIKTVRGQIQKEYVGFLEQFRTKKAGLTRDTTNLYDVVRELYKEDTGNKAAKEITGGVNSALDYGMRRYNAAGGDIIERQDFGFTTKHEQGKVASVKEKEWVKFIMDEIDPEKHLGPDGNPLTEAQLKKHYENSYESIVSGGLSDITDGIGRTQYGSSITARAASRQIHFKNADSFIRYHERFGDGNLVDHVTGTFDRLARDIATLEILGPYPEATMRFMEDQIDYSNVQKAIVGEGKKSAGAARSIGNPKVHLRSLYNTVTGRTALAANSTVASISQANRNILLSAVMGTAFFSAIADIPMQALTSKVAGIPATGVLRRHLKIFATNSQADRRLAVRLGFTAQGWADRGLALQRVIGESVGPEWSEKLADFTLRATFLTPWTEAGRYAFQTEFLGHLTEQAGKSFEELSDTALGRSFQRHGVTEEDWDIIRNTEAWVDPESGADFIRAEDVAGSEFGTKEFDAANRMQQMIFNETDVAIIQATPRVRAVLTGGQPAGTFWGEVMRNTALLKGFATSIMHTHMSRTMAQSGITGKAQYAAFLIIGMTVFGALSEQMNNIASGKDPAPMDLSDEGRKFWLKAIVRGGSLGLLGDTALRDVNRFGGGIWDTLIGPVGRQGQDALKLTLGNLQQKAAGEDTHFGREASRFIQQNTPFRSAWYGKLALERIAFDQLDYMLDKNASKNFRRVQQKAKKEFDQKYFWRPGRIKPDRAPNLSNIAR